MQVNIQEMLKECGVPEAMYPGKRLVTKLPQSGEYKSHSVVYDWRAPNLLRMEIKAGLTGKDLTVKELTKYPVSYQSPTFVEIATSSSANENSEDEDEDGDGSASGSGGGGGKKVGGKKPKAFEAFSRVVEGKLPESGEIKRMVVMGKEIAKTAFASVMEALKAQIRDMKVTPVNILAAVSDITKVAPGGRKPSEIDPSLLKGAAPYKPKDMFGVGGP